MRIHPALSMLIIWFIAGVLYFILPFRLIDKSFNYQGLITLYIFITSFCIFAYIGSLRLKNTSQKFYGLTSIDNIAPLNFFRILSIITIVTGLLDLSTTESLFNLALAYELRSQAASNLLQGSDSDSSVWFKICFLTYSASYVYIALSTMFSNPIKKIDLIFFGFLPIVIATLALGGRATVFYAALIFVLSFFNRQFINHKTVVYLRKTISTSSAFINLILILSFSVMMFYFILVFLIRAEVVGGASEMFGVAESIWGVAFDGYLSKEIFALLGDTGTYLLFVFVWYYIQGFIMGNTIISGYTGDMLLGVYGVDLVSAFFRRFDPEMVAVGFGELSNINVYGFLPSAWGSLYVDFKFFGIIFAIIWGFLAGYVYKNIVKKRRVNFLLLGPFVSLGIFFSVINTPIGFANGLMTHFWMLIGFMLLSKRARRNI